MAIESYLAADVTMLSRCHDDVVVTLFVEEVTGNGRTIDGSLLLLFLLLGVAMLSVRGADDKDENGGRRGYGRTDWWNET